MSDDTVANLHIFLSGPFVFRDDKDDDYFRILIPDLLDSHFKPGFTASDDAVELENGIWILDVGKPPRAYSRDPVTVVGSKFDEFKHPRPASSNAYAVIKVRRPDYIQGMAPNSSMIASPEDPRPKDPPATTPLATKAVLVFQNVDLAKVKLFPQIAWNSEGSSVPTYPELTPIDGVAVLNLGMQPKETPVTDDHARMAYRNMARMVGRDRYMQPCSGGIQTEHAKYNDCGAILMLVHV